jgi:pimeloyl-ACP methyl ester carboxylesterase
MKVTQASLFMEMHSVGTGLTTRLASLEDDLKSALIADSPSTELLVSIGEAITDIGAVLVAFGGAIPYFSSVETRRMYRQKEEKDRDRLNGYAKLASELGVSLDEIYPEEDDES